MSTTISKRTFFEGCYIELYKRNDGGHRIKWVSPNGDEFTHNVDNAVIKPGLEHCYFDSIANPHEPIDGFAGVGSALPYNRSLWLLLSRSDIYFNNVIRQLGSHIDYLSPESHILGGISKVPLTPNKQGKTRSAAGKS